MSLILNDSSPVTAAHYSTGHFAALDSAAYFNTTDHLYGAEDLRVGLEATQRSIDNQAWLSDDEKAMANHALDLIDNAKDGDQAAADELVSLGFFQDPAGNWLHEVKYEEGTGYYDEGEVPGERFFLNPDGTQSGEHAGVMPNGPFDHFFSEECLSPDKFSYFSQYEVEKLDTYGSNSAPDGYFTIDQLISYVESTGHLGFTDQLKQLNNLASNGDGGAVRLLLSHGWLPNGEDGTWTRAV